MDDAFVLLLTELLIVKQQYDKVCDLFSIPKTERPKTHTADQIIERIKTYQTSYLMRKSAVERENGQAFVKPDPIKIVDPVA